MRAQGVQIIRDPETILRALLVIANPQLDYCLCCTELCFSAPGVKAVINNNKSLKYLQVKIFTCEHFTVIILAVVLVSFISSVLSFLARPS